MSGIEAEPSRRVRRGELDAALSPHARAVIRGICGELRELHRRAEMIDDPYLAELIARAADEAVDQLRDDLVIREGASGPPSGRS
jgi:hypothetical protein